MATSTQTFEVASTYAGSEQKPAGLFKRALQHIMAAQERKAQAIVRQHLARLDDSQLADLGFGPKEVVDIRTKATTAGAYYWV